MSDARIEPTQVIFDVDEYVNHELSDARKFSNRQPLDDSGVWSLHRLAARIYAQGWQDGERAEVERNRARHVRERDHAADADDTPGGDE